MPTIRELLKKRLSDKQDVLRAMPGILGDISGNVAVPGRPNYVYVRLMGVSGDALAEVYNNRVANLVNLPVLVGYDPLQPNLLQVLSTRAISPQVGEDNGKLAVVQPHHLSHEYPSGSDIVWVQLMQFLPFRVFPVGGLNISIYRGVVYTGGEWRKLEETVTHDLSPYVPDTEGKACFVLITLDNTATVTFTKGAEVDLADLAGTDIPAAPAGTALVLAAIRLYAGQTTINESTTNLDIYDLRWPTYNTHSADDITSGIISQDRLGSGSDGDGTKFLADDQTWKTVVGDSKHAVIGILSGNLIVGTGVIRLYNHFGKPLTITAVYAAISTPPTGQAAIFDINLEGASIFTNQSHRPQIAAGQHEGSASAIDITNWPDGYYITIDVDQIGSGNTGSNATITIVCE